MRISHINNISLKTKITQEFDNLSYNKEEEYLIYKITNDLSQNITLDSSSSIFNLTYNESNEGTYFGLTSIKPHNSVINLQFNGTLNNLSKYIRSNSNNILSNINLKVSGTHNSNNSLNNSININWETNNNTTKTINHNYNFVGMGLFLSMLYFLIACSAYFEGINCSFAKTLKA